MILTNNYFFCLQVSIFKEKFKLTDNVSHLRKLITTVKLIYSNYI